MNAYEGIIDYFDDFEGPNKYRFLSNFYLFSVRYRGHMWRTNEHAYQAMKAINPGEAMRIRRAGTPGAAKRLGQQVTLDPHWETRKFIVMWELLVVKFKADTPLAELLLNTGDAFLIEGNTWHDQVWGDCRCDKHKAHAGENWLGRMLMMRRSDLQATISYEHELEDTS